VQKKNVLVFSFFSLPLSFPFFPQRSHLFLLSSSSNRFGNQIIRCPTGFPIPVVQLCLNRNYNSHKENKIFFSIPHIFPSIFLLSSSISLSSILSSFRLCSVLLPAPFPPSLSLSSQHIVHLLSSPSRQFLFSISSFPHLHLAVIFSLSHSPTPETPEFPLSHTSQTPSCISIF
jgi:hypothetical protein